MIGLSTKRPKSGSLRFAREDGARRVQPEDKMLQFLGLPIFHCEGDHETREEKRSTKHRRALGSFGLDVAQITEVRG